MALPSSPTTNIGYIRYKGTTNYQTTENLYTEEDLFQEEIDEQESRGCSLNFDSLANGINWNLPEFSFFAGSNTLDHSVFDKSDQIAQDVSQINNLLINAISDMECCDIAETYNDTVGEFFKFFTDGGGGANLTKTIIDISETISTLRAITEPLECLIKPLPGNPWERMEVDPLSWSYGFWKEAKPMINLFMSGELLDIIYNPIHSIRTKLQGCLNGNMDELGAGFDDVFKIGSLEQLLKLDATAAKKGDQAIDSVFPKPAKPKKPLLHETDPEYESSLTAYKKAIKSYDKQIKVWEKAKERMEKKTEAQDKLSNHLAVSLKTQSLITARTDGICGCIADALGLTEVMQLGIPLQRTKDFQKFIGKTITGVTNADAGVSSKSRPADKPYTVRSEDIQKEKAKEAIANAGKAQGDHKKVTIEEKTKKVKNAYSEVDKSASEETEIKTKEVKTQDEDGSNIEKVKNTDSTEKKIEKFKRTNIDDFAELSTLYGYMKYKHYKQLDKARLEMTAAIQGASTSATSADSIYEIELAEQILAGFLSNYIEPDFKNDWLDSKATTAYITPAMLNDMYDDRYQSSLTINQEQNLVRGLEAIAAPPNTPAQNLFNELPRATEVEIDQRTYTYLFNSGFVRRGGSVTWRNFNLLGLEWSDITKNFGAIAPDKSEIIWKAIFPNDAIGEAANLEYVTTYYNDSSLEDLTRIFLDNNSDKNIDLFFDAEEGYPWDKNRLWSGLTQEEQLQFIKDISFTNGFVAGTQWVKYMNTGDKNPYIVDNVPEIESHNLIKMEEGSVQFYSAPSQQDINLNALVGDNNNPAEVIQKINNEAILERGKYYLQALKLDTKIQFDLNAINDMRDIVARSVASMVPTDLDLVIPCKCDGMICSMINFILQYIQEAINKFMAEVMNTIAKYLIPDWVKDLMKLINEFSQCFAALFGIVSQMQDINNEKDSLLDDLRDTLDAYPSDPCFVSRVPFVPNPFLVTDEYGDPIPGDTYVDPDEDSGETYSPPEGNILVPVITDRPTDPTNPVNQTDPTKEIPILVTEVVEIVPGLPGRSIAGYKYNCDYLEI